MPLPTWIKTHTCPSDLQKELDAFDAKNKNPLPPILQRWRERWVKAIEKEKKKRHQTLGGILPIDLSSAN